MFYISDYKQRIRKIHGAKCLMVNIPNARHAQWIEQYNDKWFHLGLDWKFMLWVLRASYNEQSCEFLHFLSTKSKYNEH